MLNSLSNSLFVSFLALVWLGVGCGEVRTPGPLEDVQLAAIFISPSEPTVALEQSIQLKAVGAYSDGTTAALTSVAWRSENPALLEVDSSGVASAFGIGEVIVVAMDTLSGRQGQVTVTVVEDTSSQENAEPSLLQIEIVSSSSTLMVGDTLPLSVLGHYDDGSSETLSDIEWTSR